jgi:hemoglobin/transferrin/lactoferrin receptor protein
VLDEQYEVQGLGSRTATSRDLDPERITGIRVGSISNFANVFTQGDSAQIRTTVFQNKITNEIFKATGIGCPQQLVTGGSIADTCGKGLMGNYRNIGDANYKGFEIESFYDATYMFGALSYAWMEGRTRVPTPTLGARCMGQGCAGAQMDRHPGREDPGLGRPDWLDRTIRRCHHHLPSDKYFDGPASALGDRYYDNFGNEKYELHGCSPTGSRSNAT